MFKAADVIDAPHDNHASLIRLNSDLDWAKTTHRWLQQKGLQCDLPLPAMWTATDEFQVFGYQIKVHESRDTLIQKLDLH